MNPEKHLLHNVQWQFFCSFTFKRMDEAEGLCVSRYFATLREQAAVFGVHFFDLMWCLRKEKGEQTGRPHFHALIAGLPTSAVNISTCFSLMKRWEKLRGGMARVRVYDSMLSGVEYVLKGADEAFMASGANWYELGKFGERCDVMLSMSLIRHMQNRSRFGPRGRDGLFEDINGALVPNKLLTASSKLEGDKDAGDTVRGVVRVMNGSQEAQTNLPSGACVRGA